MDELKVFSRIYCKLMEDAFFFELISLRIRVSESSFDVLRRKEKGEKEKSLLRSQSNSGLIKIFEKCTYNLPLGESISDDQEDKV